MTKIDYTIKYDYTIKKNKNDKPKFNVISKEYAIRSYKFSKDPKTQIDVLADLCSCTKEAIIELVKDTVPLDNYGVDLVENIKYLLLSGYSWNEIGVIYGKSAGEIYGEYSYIKKKLEK